MRRGYSNIVLGRHQKIYWVLKANLNERNHLEDAGANGRIILKCILKKQDSKTWIGFIWLTTGTSEDFYEYGYEFPSPIIYGEIFTCLKTIPSPHELSFTDLID